MKPAMRFLLVCLLFIPPSLIAQTEDGGVVQIVTYWEPGDSHSYSLEIGTEMSISSGASESFTTYHVLIEVLEHSDTGYLIQWTYSDVVPPKGASAFEKRVVKMGAGLPVRYYVTELGEFVGVENWEEIAAKAKVSLAGLRKEFAAEPDIDNSIDTIMEAFETKEQFESLAMEEIQLYHLLHGYSYLMDEPIVVEGETANPFGGKSVFSKTTIELSEVNKDKSTAYLVYNRGYEQAALARVVFEAVNGYLPDEELTEEQSKDLPNLDMEIRKQFIFHTGSGWLLEAYSERHVDTDGESRTDSIYIKFLE